MFRESIWRWLTSRLTVGTQSRYAVARDVLDEWCRSRGFAAADVPSHELDVVCARCILDELEDEDDHHTKQRYLDMVATLQRRHSVRMRLSMKLLAEWQKMQPKQAEALSWEVTFAMSVTAVWRHDSPSCAIHFIICFCGLLRIRESLALRAEDVWLSPPADLVPLAVIIVRTSKRGFDQRIVLESPGTIEWLRAFRLAHPAAGGEPFAPCSYGRVSCLMRAILTDFGLEGYEWRSHSLRRGGATALAEAGVHFKDIQVFGRWVSESSAREYIRRGCTALLRRRQGHAELLERLARIASVGHRALACRRVEKWD